MQNGGFVSWEGVDIIHARLCTCVNCVGVIKMPTEEELDQIVNAMIEKQEDAEKAIRIEIDITSKGGDKG